MNKVQNF